MQKEIVPPESAIRIEDCKFRTDNDQCCHAKNYLRPHRCNGFCVYRVDQWLRETHPEMSDEEVVSLVARLTEHDGIGI